MLAANAHVGNIFLLFYTKLNFSTFYKYLQNCLFVYVLCIYIENHFARSCSILGTSFNGTRD